MNKISIKGIILGSITDIVATNIFMIPLAVYATLVLMKSGVSKDDIQTAVTTAMKDNSSYYWLSNVIGSLCSVLGGYVSARVAKHDEILNGVLTSALCILIGIYTIYSGSVQPHALQNILLIVLSPAITGFGGYLRYRQIKPCLMSA